MEVVLNSDVSHLKELLKKGEVSSRNLVMIFTSRCLDIGMQLNCITEFNFEDALSTADRLDAQR